ncbi:MAG: Transcriptional regulator, NifA subfamily, Fis Family, partial [Phycisphaerales bacterium]|nr:Transcriptional regulator, NifA subfamily, Fis Family [Phycisphaerales bacterium]
IERVGRSQAPVHICGESGSGKELVAHLIHESGARRDGPFVPVNCGAIPTELMESEFFGHKKGSFTGAVADKQGLIQSAEGGTLFLDEIGEVPLAMQAKLLRVLQEQEIERVGDTRTRKVDVRIIAATNRDLKSEVDAGRFRQDLFYRLSVFPIEIPPLRERREDIPLLAAHFARESAQKMNRPDPLITRATMDQLTAYDWPGNVRELQNAVERSVILSQGEMLRFDVVNSKPVSPPRAATETTAKPAVLTREELKRQECENIIGALKQAEGKVYGRGGAAEILGMKPTTLASRIRALRIVQEAGEWSRS